MTSFISLFIQEANAATSAAPQATAAAQDAGAQAVQQGSPWSPLIMIGLMFVVFYFLLIRPQKKKQKEIRKMRESLGEGSTVITQGGIYGKIVAVKDNSFIISIADGVKIKVLKDMVYSSPEDATQAQQK